MTELAISVTSSLATDLYVYLSSQTDKFEIIVLIIGTFLCLCGLKFKKITQNLVLWFLTASILYRHKPGIEDFCAAIETVVHNLTQDKLLPYFSNGGNSLGFAILTLFITIVIISALSWAKFISSGFLIFILYYILEPICILHFGNIAPIICIAASLACFFVIYSLLEYITFFITGIAICFVGIYIDLIPLSYRFNSLSDFKRLHNDIVNLESRTLSDPLFYLILGTAALLFYIQISFYKL